MTAVPPVNPIGLALLDLMAALRHAYLHDITTTENRSIISQVPPGSGPCQARRRGRLASEGISHLPEVKEREADVPEGAEGRF